ncbi:Peptidase M13 [Actinomortierella ambigua]|nr:Peptidase M13 [Actinomortierella ambigua]
MNAAVDPCEDFYEYSCGGFLRTAKIPPTTNRLSYGGSEERIKETIRMTLESGPGGPNGDLVGAESRILQKAQVFYKSCMNETRIAEVGTAPLYKELGLLVTTVFPVPGSFMTSLLPGAEVPARNATDRERLTSAIAHLYRTSALSLLGFDLKPDARTPEAEQLYIDKSSSDFPTSLLINIASSDLLAEYRAAIMEMYTSIFGQAQGAAKFADEVIALETKILKFANGADAPPYMTPEQLNQRYPSIDWPQLFREITQGYNNLTFDAGKEVKNNDPQYLDLLDKLFLATPASTLQIYFVWETIMARSRLLPTAFRQRINRIRIAIYGFVDPTSIPSREEICVESTSAHLGSIVGHFYVSQQFPKATRDQTQTIVDSIIEAYHANVLRQEWLDTITRDNAVKKLDAMLALIGASAVDPNVSSAPELEVYYEKVIAREDDYYSNAVQASAQALQQLLNRLGKPADRRRMREDPQAANAYYFNLMNHFGLLAGIVQPPMFTPGAPEYLNYGGVGMIIGHEISHGFDTLGRSLGPRGEQVDWWTNTTAVKFQSLSQCFITQYSNITIKSPSGKVLTVNGQQTLGENIADNGGLKVAFEAWAKRFASNRDSQRINNKILPLPPQRGGLSSPWTHEQLFFISFAQSRCSILTPGLMALLRHIDVHAPDQARVIGTLQNSREFARAFNCRTNSFMNPVTKCEMW